MLDSALDARRNAAPGNSLRHQSALPDNKAPVSSAGALLSLNHEVWRPLTPALLLPAASPANANGAPQPQPTRRAPPSLQPPHELRNRRAGSPQYAELHLVAVQNPHPRDSALRSHLPCVDQFSSRNPLKQFT
jgi:hypothetical protein